MSPLRRRLPLNACRFLCKFLGDRERYTAADAIEYLLSRVPAAAGWTLRRGAQWAATSPGTSANLFAVRGSGPANVFAAGSTVLLRYDGNGWIQRLRQCASMVVSGRTRTPV